MPKLRAIHKLRHVKNFSRFTTAEDLNKKNVIYAPTGVGKTNLSRFLRAISDDHYDLEQLKSKEADEREDIEFTVALQDNRVLTKDNYRSEDFGPIQVYNADFIERNIRSQEMSADNISGTLEVELGDEHNRLIDLEKKIEDKEEELRDTESELQENLEAKRENIRVRDPRGQNILKKLEYANVEQTIYERYLDEEDQWRDAWKYLEKIQDIDADDKIEYALSKVETDKVDFSWLKEHLRDRHKFPEPPVGELKDHLGKITSQWIEDGLKYHEDDEEGRCPFCRKAKDGEFEKILDKYREYVSSEEVEFKKNCRKQIRHLERLKEKLGRVEQVELKAVVESKAKSLGEDVTWNDLNVSELMNEIDRLIAYTQEKMDAPEVPVSAAEGDGADDFGAGRDITDIIDGRLERLNKSISSNAVVVETLNTRMDDLSRRKAALRTLIGKGELVEFYATHRRSIEERDKLKGEISELERKAREVRERLPSVDASEKVVQLFNRFIRRMGIEKYQAEVKEGEEDRKRIVLRLNDAYDVSADVNEVLSEGEKDAVSLSYFLASVILRLNSLNAFANAVIVVDDPVNSLNYRYFYGVCSVIKTFANDIKEVLGGDENNPNPQVIILTHNMQFYNMVLDHVFKGGASYYQLEEVNGQHRLRCLTGGEKLSSFRTALRRIKGYAEEKHTDNIGNDIRKVLETLCLFHGYKLDRVSVKAIFADQKEEVNEALLMFAHDQSHADLNDFADGFDTDMYKELANHLLDLMSVRYRKIIADLPEY